MSQKLVVHLTPEQRAELEKMTRSGEGKAREIARARILLLADKSQARERWKTQAQVAEAVGVCPMTVCRVCRRFVASRTGQTHEQTSMSVRAGLKEQPRPGQAPKVTGEVEARLLTLACSKPPEGRARWTVRLLRDELIRLEVIEGISHVAVHTVLKKTRSNLGRSSPGA
jgi:hypothetical protein